MITIVYAYRNRELSRIKASLDSLQIQSVQTFNVVFIDYGSELEMSLEIQMLLENYAFVKYYYVYAQFLLWNKSKALNYGIKKVTTKYVFIADVDLIFRRDTILFLESIKHPDKINLFKLAYLDKQNSKQLLKTYTFEKLISKHIGEINGMILATKTAFEKVQGYDTFFHFYGSEDVDLYNRLSNADYEIVNNQEIFFYHNWHTIYASYDDKKMSNVPRLFNIKRINEQHYFSNLYHQLLIPYRQPLFGSIVSQEDQIILKNPTLTFELKNIHAQVFHFFNEQIRTYKNEIVCIIIKEDVYYKSMKYFLKKIVKRQTQPYISMKFVNDIILNKVIYEYRDFNYAYIIAEDLKTITFTIRL